MFFADHAPDEVTHDELVGQIGKARVRVQTAPEHFLVEGFGICKTRESPDLSAMLQTEEEFVGHPILKAFAIIVN